jgi:6,7-dimethyl-8-ribityllumazine synthase
LQAKIHQGHLRADGFRYAIVASRWNDFLTSKLIEGSIDALERLGADEGSIEVFKVPGSFEIPMIADKVAKSGRFDAIICVGTILRGQTPHFDFVAGAATRGIADVAMTSGIPVLYGIITADTLEQAIDRAGVKAGNKGFEAAQAAVEMVNLYKDVQAIE